MDYTATQINRLAEEASYGEYWSVNIAANNLIVYRFLLIGGAPHDAPVASHLAVLPKIAAVGGVDVEEYYVLGITLQPVESGQVLKDQWNNEVTTTERSWVCDVVIRSPWYGMVWIDSDDQEAAMRNALATWAGGYAPIVKMLAWQRDTQPSAGSQTTGALQFWGTQPPLFYGVQGSDPVRQKAYDPNAGTLGVGFSQGLSDYPGELVPLKWSTSVVQPGPTPTGPTPIGPSPVEPGTTQPGGASSPSSSNQNWLVMAACAAAGYFVYRNLFGRSSR